MSFTDLYKNNKLLILKILVIAGIFIMLIGAIDPLEGSILMLCGAVLVYISAFLIKSKQRKITLIALIMEVFGISFLFIFSFLGGIGGKSKYPLWLGVLCLPYIIGWGLSLFGSFFLLKELFKLSKLKNVEGEILE
jgi:hypothetical protein